MTGGPSSRAAKIVVRPAELCLATKLSFLPMTFSRSRDVTVTPSAFRSNTNALVSLLEEGRVESITDAATAKLIIPALPIFDFAFNNKFAKIMQI